jgi:ribonuclease HI
MHIYTDGGCSGNPGPGGWAFVIVDADSASIIKEAWGTEGNTTNNRMELMAVISALEAWKQVSLKQVSWEQAPEKQSSLKIEIFTDSQYVQKGMSQWIKDWKARGWKTAGKDPVKNQDLWQRLDALAADLTIAWHWVKGHAGNTYNERCDDLTQKAIKSLL